MERQQFDISELIASKMSQPVKNKQGQTILNEDGQAMTTMEAIAMTVVQNAMKGDMSSVFLVRNLTRRSASAEDIELAQKDYEERKRRYMAQISDELKAQGLWFEQMLDIETVAKIMCVADRVEMSMQDPDYEDLITEIRRDGTQNVRLNPLHERFDEIQRQIRNALDKLYADAVKRKSTRRIRHDNSFLTQNI